VRSVAVGIWAGSGTRHESPEVNGISHFIEHMLFKGTHSRSASELAEEMDMLGGEINAFTTKECTCYYGRVLDTEFSKAVDLLSDMFFNSKFDEESVAVERGVILEEINMSRDDPADLSVENLLLGVYKGTPLGMPILGSRESLETITGAVQRDYVKSHYTGNGIVISVAGNYSDSDIENIKRIFSAAPALQRPRSGEAEYRKHISSVAKQTEQNHIAIGFPGLSYKSEKRFTLQILNGIIGANMSSRLFQRIREELGLCYTVYSFLSSHEETGVFGIYLGTGKETEKKAVEEIGAELKRLLSEGISSEEINRVRTQIKSGMLMALESTSSRMNHMGKSLLLSGSILAPDDIAARYDAVTSDDIAGLADEIFKPENLSVSAVAQQDGPERYAGWFDSGFHRNS
jgi:predicted Zn-dependent peptidase